MNSEERLRQMLDRARGHDEVTAGEWESFSTRARRSIRMQRTVAAGFGVVCVVAVIVGAASLFESGENRGLVTPVGPTEDGRPLRETYMRPTESWMIDPEPVPALTRTWTYWEVARGKELDDVLQMLLSGPNGAEQEEGWVTSIPPQTELISTNVEDGTATVDLSAPFARYGDGRGIPPTTIGAREAQVVFTATQLPGIDQVKILVEGESHFIGGRADVGPVAPPIVVETPKIGERISGPVTVSGTADVFEGTVAIEVVIPREEKDEKIVSTYATATCGSGCRGPFKKDLIIDGINRQTKAFLNVYEESAEDGSKLHEVSIPITLFADE